MYVSGILDSSFLILDAWFGIPDSSFMGWWRPPPLRCGRFVQFFAKSLRSLCECLCDCLCEGLPLCDSLCGGIASVWELPRLPARWHLHFSTTSYRYIHLLRSSRKVRIEESHSALGQTTFLMYLPVVGWRVPGMNAESLRVQPSACLATFTNSCSCRFSRAPGISRFSLKFWNLEVLTFWNLEMFGMLTIRKHIWLFSLFSKLRACSVSVAALGSFVYAVF